MDEFDLPPDPTLPAQPKKGRGAAENIAHRFSSEQRVREDDGWRLEEEPAPRTELFTDTAKTVISRNDSPDLGFDQSINPYRGCEHGCIYCYARPTHAWLGLSPGLDFEQKIFHKPDVVARLKEELAKPGYRCSSIALGTATDVYQPFERKLDLTRGMLETLLACRHPVTVVTKSALVLRDLDLWQALAQQKLGAVIISLTSLDSELSRKLEPRASAPAARLKTIETLAAAGIPVTVFLAPLIPGLNDHELEKLLAAAQASGATSASYTLLRLPHEVAGLFGTWLEQHAPEKAARVMHVLYDIRGGKANDANFGSRMKGLGHYAELIRQRFELTARKLALGQSVPKLDTTQFIAPRREADSAQLSLF